MGSSLLETSPSVGSTPFSGRARWREDFTGLAGGLARPGAASVGSGAAKQAARKSARVVFPSRVIGDIRRVPQNPKSLRENRVLYFISSGFASTNPETRSIGKSIRSLA